MSMMGNTMGASASTGAGTMSSNRTAVLSGVHEEMERGIAAVQSGDKATAHNIFRSMAGRYADFPELWVWLGGTSTNLDEAEAAFQRATMLDPANEEANLGLRWVALRKQVVVNQASNAMTTTMTTSNLPTGAFDRGAFTTGPISSGPLTGPLRAADADKSVKMKVGGGGSRRLGIPPAAIVMLVVSLVLYAIVFYFLWLHK